MPSFSVPALGVWVQNPQFSSRWLQWRQYFTDREQLSSHKQTHITLSLKPGLSPVEILILGSNRFSCVSLLSPFQKIKVNQSFVLYSSFCI